MTEIARERCITCSDEAVEARSSPCAGPAAIVQVAGERESVAIDLVPDAAPGDLLLCHAGIALERLDRARESMQVAQSHNVQRALADARVTTS